MHKYFSDAIIEGRDKVVPTRSVVLDEISGWEKPHGCAIGMAVIGGQGEIFIERAHNVPGIILRVPDRWEWMWQDIAQLPCNCFHTHDRSPLAMIAHLFDDHVMTPELSYDHWTFEQLINWVREMEYKHEAIANNAQTNPERVPSAPATAFSIPDPGECVVAGEVGQGDFSSCSEGWAAAIDALILEAEIQSEPGIYTPGYGALFSGKDSEAFLEESALVGV